MATLSDLDDVTAHRQIRARRRARNAAKSRCFSGARKRGSWGAVSATPAVQLTYRLFVAAYLHVTSSLNRSSILRYGLDWTRMGAAPGIAGSRRPEVDGCFLCVHVFESVWFIKMNNTGGPVDVWEVDGVAPDKLIEPSNGHKYVSRKVEPDDLRLLHQDIPALDWSFER